MEQDQFGQTGSKWLLLIYTRVHARATPPPLQTHARTHIHTHTNTGQNLPADGKMM